MDKRAQLVRKNVAARLVKATKERGLEDYEYLLHHVQVGDRGEEVLHHCFVYDHLGNLFSQKHLVVADGKATLGGRAVADGTFHVIAGLEPTQEVSWSNEEAKQRKIKIKEMQAGMSAEEKAKVW